MTKFTTLLVGLLVAGLTAACAGHTQSDTLRVSRTQTPAAGTAATAEATPDITGSSLASPFTYDQGMFALSPVPAAVSPHTTSAAALAAFNATGLYSNAPSFSSPEVFFADYTNYGKGSDVGGQLQLEYRNTPVWVVRYVNVPDAPAGSDTTNPSPVPHDILAIVNDADGQVLEVDSDLPDASAMPAPPAVAPGKTSNGK